MESTNQTKSVAIIEPEFIQAETIPAEPPQPVTEIKVSPVVKGLFLLGMALGALLISNQQNIDNSKK
jgi:hypothetical protein